MNSAHTQKDSYQEKLADFDCRYIKELLMKIRVEWEEADVPPVSLIHHAKGAAATTGPDSLALALHDLEQSIQNDELESASRKMKAIWIEFLSGQEGQGDSIRGRNFKIEVTIPSGMMKPMEVLQLLDQAASLSDSLSSSPDREELLALSMNAGDEPLILHLQGKSCIGEKEISGQLQRHFPWIRTALK